MLVRALLIVGIVLMFVSSGASARSQANVIASQMRAQGRLMWMDADANMRELASRPGVAKTVGQCKSANINTIIVDVKPLSGFVLYNSRISPKTGRLYPPGYDLLQTMVEEGHRAGISVHAAINVLSEGSQIQPGGPAFTNPNWQCVQYDVERTLVLDDGTRIPMECVNCRLQPGKLCLYGPGVEPAGDLPEGTVYVRVFPDGRPTNPEPISGTPRIRASEGSYILLATGSAGEQLRRIATENYRLKMESKALLRNVSAGTNVHNAIFINPLHPDARAHALGVVREICENYAIDGLMLDRMRFPNIYSDFSDISRQTFEKYIGKQIQNWPEDVFTINPAPGSDIIRGPLFKDWVKFRAQVIRDFLAEVRGIVKAVKPGAQLGIYVGSWYPLYYDVGVNWGSPNHTTDLEWWPEGYEATGYAGLVDYMCTGCYYTYPTRAQARAAGEEEWKSVEAAAEESVNAVKDETFVYGSLYLRQYNGRPAKFKEAMQQCLTKTQGCMFFDLVYVRDYDWWSILGNTFTTPARAPHDIPELMVKLREVAKQ